jgi:phosphoribosyl-dephospho-CoA transferase
VGPGQRTDLTAGQALRTQELLEELEERKAIKNQCLEEKRGLVQEI